MGSNPTRATLLPVLAQWQLVDRSNLNFGVVAGSSPAWATILKRNFPLTIIDIPMQKIPSLFQRDYEGNRQVINQVVDGCQWVLLGEGIATEKIDGTCCMIREGELFRRHDRKQGKPAPSGWIAAEPAPDPVTGHWPGWMKVTDTPADRWHREAFDANRSLPDGTYELVGPKIQGNAYQLTQHELRSHESATQYPLFPRSFDAIREALQEMSIEGIVWHHPDGRMCKIKRRDFGLPWPDSDC